MKKPTLIKINFLLLLSLFLTTTGLQCKLFNQEEQALLEKVELTWWGSVDDPKSYSDIIYDYQALHPHIRIYYRKLRAEEFETELLNALAEDRGPDIMTIHSTWMTKYLPKLQEMPVSTKVAYQMLKKTLGIKEEIVIEFKDTPSLTPAQLKNSYVDVVFDDAIRENKIYGLPLSVDTLALFYNRDLFNNAGIPLPPADWTTLQQNVKKLTTQDKSGNLVQSGVALGTPDNITFVADILSLLMMQNGAEMTIGKQVTFGLIPTGFPDRNYNPGLEAIRFFTDFANPSKEVYTWNDKMPNSLEAFAQGKLAMFFGYNSQIPYLEAIRSGKLNYSITKMPQIDGRPEVNFASYWMQTVSKKSKNSNEAWDFIQFMSKAQEAKKYLDKTKRPAALRSLIAEQQEDDSIKIFADQLLTAKSWYRGEDVLAMEKSFKDMITALRSGQNFTETIEIAIRKIQQTF